MTEELQTLTSDEVKAKLEAHETIEKVHIEYLSLGKHEFDFPLHFVECEIVHLDLNNSIFKEDVTLRRCNIKMFVGTEATFEKKLDLQGTSFGRGRVQRAKIKGEFNGKQTLLNHTSFHESTFEQKTSFRNSLLNNVTFSNVSFEQEAIFVEVQFQGKANFQSTVWKGVANFKKIKALEDLDFQHSHFHSHLQLHGGVIALSLDLGFATLEGFTDFRDSILGRSLFLGGVKLGENQGFRFFNTSASSIILNRDTVEGHIAPEKEGKHRAASREYAFLRSTFQSINRFADEDWAFYQFKKMERMGTPFSLNPIALLKRGLNYFFLDLGCGYGTKPFRTLLVCGIMILLFALCYFGYYHNQPVLEHYGVDSPFLNRVLYSLDVSLVAFSGGYGDLIDFHVRGPIKLLAMAEYLLGVVFMGLFIVAFSRKVIR